MCGIEATAGGLITMSRRRYVSDGTGVLRTLVVDHGKSVKKTVKKRPSKACAKKGFSRNIAVGKGR